MKSQNILIKFAAPMGSEDSGSVCFFGRAMVVKVAEL